MLCGIEKTNRRTDLKAILFDLDGTLIDSSEGITKSAQYALAHYGIEENDLKKAVFLYRTTFVRDISDALRFLGGTGV